MEFCRHRSAALFAAALLLALWGCSDAAGGRPTPGSAAENDVTITACFRREEEDGPLDGAVRLSAGGEQVDYPIYGGEAELPGLPRRGDAALTLLDSQGAVLGTVRLSISEGAVIDAASDGSGSAHITLKEDTDQVAVAFILQPDGSISCALRLARAESYGS